MDDINDLETDLINVIGLFPYGKANWLEYVDRMDSYFMQYQCIIGDTMKKDICLAAVGAKTLRILKSIISPKKLQDPEVTYNFVMEALEKHFYPVHDVPFYISKFQLRKQAPFETFFDYVIALRKLMINCQFSRKSQHSKLRNQIVAGATETLKSKFNGNSMSLSQLFEVGLLFDETRAVMPVPRARNHKARKNRVHKCFRCGVAKSSHTEPCVFDWSICSGCGIKGHLSLICKYKDMTCNNCEAKGHVIKLCKKPPGKPVTVMMTELSIASEE